MSTQAAEGAVNDQALEAEKKKSLKDIQKELREGANRADPAIKFQPKMVQSIMGRVEYVRTIAKLSLFASLFLAVTVVVMAMVVWQLASREPDIRVLSYDPVSGEYVQLEAGKPAKVSFSNARNFAQLRILEMNSISYSDFFLKIKSMEQHFVNERAFLAYQQQMEASDLIAKLKKNYLISSAVLQDIELVNESRNMKAGGAKEWTFTTRFRRELAGGGKVPERNLIEAAILVREVPRYVNVSGLKIVSYIERQLD